MYRYDEIDRRMVDERVAQIAIRFPVFTDGRGYSAARVPLFARRPPRGETRR